MPSSQLDGPLLSPYFLPFLPWGLAIIRCWLKWSWTTCFIYFHTQGLLPNVVILCKHPFAPQSLRLKHKKRPHLQFSALSSKLYPDASCICGEQDSTIFLVILTFTWADDTNILIESTVVLAPAGVPAVPKVGFSSSTLHIIQMDNFSTGAKVRQSQDRDSSATVKLSAHNVGTVHIEIIITDCAPFSIMKNFNPPGTSVLSRFQSQLWLWWN